MAYGSNEWLDLIGDGCTVGKSAAVFIIDIAAPEKKNQRITDMCIAFCVIQMQTLHQVGQVSIPYSRYLDKAQRGRADECLPMRFGDKPTLGILH